MSVHVVLADGASHDGMGDVEPAGHCLANQGEHVAGRGVLPAVAAHNLPHAGKPRRIAGMGSPLRVLACAMTLTTMVSPWATVVWTAVHRALDGHHHREEAATHDDFRAALVALHGHSHTHDISEHRHHTTTATPSNAASSPGPTAHPSMMTTYASAGAAMDLAVHVRTAPSPPQRVPVILRIDPPPACQRSHPSALARDRRRKCFCAPCWWVPLTALAVPAAPQEPVTEADFIAPFAVLSSV